MHPQKELILKLWPDKLVYGGTMVMLTGLLGVVQAVAFMMAPARITDRVPIHPLDNFLTLSLSIIAAGLAYWGVRTFRIGLVAGGAAAGLLSVSLLGMGALLSLIAIGFLIKSFLEGEHRNPETVGLDVLEWPDKSLAASLVAFVGGCLSIGWAALLITGYVSMGTTTSILWAALSFASGVLSLVAAFLLHRQRGRTLGMWAGFLAIPAAAIVVIGPLLGIISAALVMKAHREREFEAPAATA